MSEEKQEFSTPHRGTEDKEAEETGIKQIEESNMQESSAPPQENEENQEDLDGRL